MNTPRDKPKALASVRFEQTPSNFAKQDRKSCGIAEQCGVAEYSTLKEDCPLEDESGWISPLYAYEKASTESSPHFIQLMKESHLKSLYVLADFTEHIPPKMGEFVIRGKDEKSWTIKIYYPKKRNSCAFAAGWPQYVHDNDIQVGDLLIVKLDGVNISILKVKKPCPSDVNKFLSLTSHPQNKKPKAPATKPVEVRSPRRAYATRSTGPVATQSPPLTVYCHGFASRKLAKDCLPCSRCTKKFSIASLTEKFNYVKATIGNINLTEWVCPSCKGDCKCKDCIGKLIAENFLHEQPSSPPPPPNHALDEVADGSVYSGIFHATNAESDFGVILKMACLTKAGSSQGHKSISDFVNKTPTKTLIIPSRQLVQIVAKSVPVTKDGLTDELQHEKQQEIMTDTSISRSRHVELERELEPWVPDDNIECSELDNTFDRHWNRGWDQFVTNAALFGVTSTFDEELYTTKLDRGPMMREREREALRIAREIEGEDTKDLHLAEERGIHVHSNFDLDEETKYSSVMRGVDDSGYEENEGIWDSENNESFGNVSDNTINKSSTDSENRIHVNHSSQKKDKRMLFEQYEASKLEDAKKESFEKGLSADATAYALSNVMSKAQETTSSSEVSEGPTTVKKHEATQPATSTSEFGNVQSAASAPGLSPSSSMNSLNLEKSTLNPHAKEFKFNPNAKSFVPVPTPVRPAAPVSDGSYYYPPNVAPVSHMQMGTSFAPHQPVMYGPHTTSYQSQQPYFLSNIPQYGQQVHILVNPDR